MQFNHFENEVFSLLEYGIVSNLSTKYPLINCSNETSETEPDFPNVFINHIGGQEMGKDLQGNELNAITDIMQVIVTTNTTKSECQEVAWEVVNQLKSLGYEMSGIPLPSKRNNIHSYSITCQRVVGGGDKL